MHWLLYYCCLCSIWTARKMHGFQGYFPGLFRTLSFNFQDFPEPKWFSRTFQKKIPDFPGCVGTPTEQRHKQSDAAPVEYQRWESFAVHVLGNDDQRLALSVGELQRRDHRLDAGDLLLTEQNQSVLELALGTCTQQSHLVPTPNNNQHWRAHHSLSTKTFHDQNNNENHDLSAQHISPNKRKLVSK